MKVNLVDLDRFNLVRSLGNVMLNPYEPPEGVRDSELFLNSLGAVRGWPIMRLLVWGAGFVFLFGANALAELVILPQLGLSDTPLNDAYFMSWWIVVGIWLVLGNAFLAFWSFKQTDKQG